MQAGVWGANDNTEWKWVWKHGGNNAESVAKKGLRPRHQSATASRCFDTKVLRYQSASAPKCYDTKVLRHQSATASKWDTSKVVPPAWRSLGGAQTHGRRLDEHKSRRNGNGDSEEIQTVIREKYKHRRHGELGLDWEEMGGGGKKLNIIEWEIYLGNLPRQKVPDNYFFPLERFVFPSARKNEA